MKSNYILRSYCFLVLILWTGTLLAHRPDYLQKRKMKQQALSLRADCAPSRSVMDQSINNVRARLLGGGDVWWDLSDGKYIVPKVDPASGIPEVSAIFAGAVWLGGYDPVGNLKLAAQTYRSGTANDFWPGPLDPVNGTIDIETCFKWDKHFKVLGSNIALHLANYNKAIQAGVPYDCNTIPEDVLGWPARGNPYFADLHGFELPNTTQGLAAFFDNNRNGRYNPCDGDYPVIEIRGCNAPQYPDEMIFWIYNDAGGIHTQTQGKPIQMEIQVQSFAYATNDEINDMTFQRYKLINRATTTIDSTYFAMWVDPDLGCFTDDYIGCDTSRSLAYVYNEDATDGETGCACPGGVNTYCNEVPILGVDYFRGPLDENGNEIGMSSFTYYNNQAVGNWPNGMTDPQVAQEYYNYLSGSWKDGTRFSYGGTAYQLGGSPINYSFTEPPNQASGWSMCTANLDFGDRRMIQASGPFRLDPGAVNELIVGVVWVPDFDYPCPNIERLLSADDIAQSLFDNCFDITDGPDAPDVDIVELDKELILILTNDSVSSNNRFEAYAEVDLQAPAGEVDSLYRFEGYKIYQLINSEVSVGELNDFEKARLIYQVDLKNNVQSVYNWTSIPNPNSSEPVWIPELKVEGANTGIRRTFKVTEDQFASEDRALVNHKKYYFTAIAYAYNGYAPFDPKDVVGQRRPYLEGRRNIRKYEGTPRSIVYTQLNAKYGDGAVVTRLDGQGAGSNFLELSPESRNAIVNGPFTGEITYTPGQGPVKILVFNPLDVKDGEFILKFSDRNLSDNILDPNARWTLTKADDPNRVIVSETTLARLNEQVIASYGFSIVIGQTPEAGSKETATNGALGGVVEYTDKNKSPWLSFIPDGEGVLHYIKTNSGEADNLLDPDRGLSAMGPLVPFLLTDYRRPAAGTPYISPSWHDQGQSFEIVRQRAGLKDLNNIDIVLTPDKKLWSRCVVVETANLFYTSSTVGLGIPAIGNARNFDLRRSPSVGKEDTNNDGLPDPDGDGEGMAWFPGYAIDVETGQRLNIFFGENSVYDGRFFKELFTGGQPIGGDMMWNPTNQLFLDVPAQVSIYNFLMGGQHFIYVSNTAYDACAFIRTRLDPTQNELRKINALTQITWTGIPVLSSGQTVTSYKDGLIPHEVTIKLRVDNPYGVAQGTGVNQGHPAYRFKLSNLEAKVPEAPDLPEALKAIKAVPNPYYGYSSYETSQFSNIVKITNLPANCVVTIYSLDGRFIRQYKRIESRLPITDRSNPAINDTQIQPDLEWDLKNAKGIPVASGVYLIHVSAPDIGERVIKWFGVQRKFDPSGL